jgi:hypothetical protein
MERRLLAHEYCKQAPPQVAHEPVVQHAEQPTAQRREQRKAAGRGGEQLQVGVERLGRGAARYGKYGLAREVRDRQLAQRASDLRGAGSAGRA